MISNNIETITPKWCWNPSTSETEILNDKLTIVDSGQGKAWTTAIGPDISVNRQPNTFYYYEIKVEFCNTSNSIKIVFGLMSKRYMDRTLSINKGDIGSLRGSSPFGYFKEFGEGAICYYANGTISRDGYHLTNQKAKPYTTDDRIGMLIDTVNSNVAFFKNGILQTSFINIIEGFQVEPKTTPLKTNFPIFPSISLIKQNSVSIVKEPTIPTFFYDTNNLIQILNDTSISDSNSNNNNSSNSNNSGDNSSRPLATTTTTTTNSTTSSNENNVNKKIDINVQNSNNNKSETKPLSPPVNNNNNNNSNSNKPTTTTATAAVSVPPPQQSTSINKELPDPNNNCPVCGISFKSIGKDWASINKHIDECLTFNLLDKETDDPKRPENVKCPYCRKSIATVEFIYHCNDKHLLENNHNHKCPLCNEKSSNLISHLSKSHVRVPQKQVGVAYSISTLEQDLGEQECAICLEEFYQGQQVARLECWCIFHQNCISSYIAKSKKCPVHN